MPTRISAEYAADRSPNLEVESGYVSGSSSRASTPEVQFTTPHLTFLNRQLQNLEPQGIRLAPLSSKPTSNLPVQKSYNGQ